MLQLKGMCIVFFQLIVVRRVPVAERARLHSECKGPDVATAPDKKAWAA